MSVSNKIGVGNFASNFPSLQLIYIWTWIISHAFIKHFSCIYHAFIFHAFLMHLFPMQFSCIYFSCIYFSCNYFSCNSHAFIFHAFISHVILMHFSCNMGAFPTLYTYILGWVKKNTFSILTFPVSQIGAPTYINVFDKFSKNFNHISRYPRGI